MDGNRRNQMAEVQIRVYSTSATTYQTADARYISETETALSFPLYCHSPVCLSGVWWAWNRRASGVLYSQTSLVSHSTFFGAQVDDETRRGDDS
jgi:hypothetical protein